MLSGLLIAHRIIKPLPALLAIYPILLIRDFLLIQKGWQEL